MYTQKPSDSLHANGEQELYRQHEADIRPILARKFANQLAGAGFFRRFLIRRRIERRIQEEVRKRMPTGADYLSV